MFRSAARNVCDIYLWVCELQEGAFSSWIVLALSQILVCYTEIIFFLTPSFPTRYIPASITRLPYLHAFLLHGDVWNCHIRHERLPNTKKFIMKHWSLKHMPLDYPPTACARKGVRRQRSRQIVSQTQLNDGRFNHFSTQRPLWSCSFRNHEWAANGRFTLSPPFIFLANTNN